MKPPDKRFSKKVNPHNSRQKGELPKWQGIQYE